MYTILVFGRASGALTSVTSLERIVLTSSVSLFKGYPYFRGVFILGVSLFQGCPYFRGGVFLFHGVLVSRVFLFQGCPYFRGALISRGSLYTCRISTVFHVGL